MHDLKPGQADGPDDDVHASTEIEFVPLEAVPRQRSVKWLSRWRYVVIGGILLVLVAAGVALPVLQRPAPVPSKSASQPAASPIPSPDVVQPSPNVNIAVVDGIIYTGTADGFVYALHAANGRVVWHNRFDGSCDTTPVVRNGIVYLVARKRGNTLVAVRASDGNVLWKYAIPDDYMPDPTVVDGVVYVPSRVDLVSLRASDGHLLWRFSTKVKESYWEPVVLNGVVYASGKENGESIIYALHTSDGSLLWSYKTKDGELDKPIVTGDMLYLTSSTAPDVRGTVLALRAKDGKLTWHQQLAESGFASLSVHDGTLYLIGQKVILPGTPTPVGQVDIAPLTAAAAPLLHVAHAVRDHLIT